MKKEKWFKLKVIAKILTALIVTLINAQII